MKAVILAAGGGTRLRPLTDTVPKPMVPVAGRPLIEHTVRQLARAGITDILITLHHLPEVIPEHFGDGSRWGVRITYSHEKTLLGTAGALRDWADRLEESFLVVYGDNLTTCDLPSLIDRHRVTGAFVTVALFWRDETQYSGAAKLDDSDRILGFVEKPPPGTEPSHWVSAGLLVLEPQVISTIPPDGAIDFGRHMLPAWIAAGRHVQAYRMTHPRERIWWVDTAADLDRVSREMADSPEGHGL